MADVFRRTFLFAAGALAATTALVRVRSNVEPRPVDLKNMFFAILAEGTRWEVRVSGGAMSGTWHVDVPEAFRNLSPPDRMIAVDKIMCRIADGAKARPARPALPSPSAQLIARRQLARIEA